MRIRSIKPSFWSHRMHRRLSDFDALLALALLSFADDEGRFVRCYTTMRAFLFTHRQKTDADLEASLKKLAEVEWLTLYEGVVDGERLPIGCITKFRDHQVINKPAPSHLPAPPPLTNTTVALPDDSRNVTVALPEDSRNVTITEKTRSREDYGSPTVGLPWDRKGKEGIGEERKGEDGGAAADSEEALLVPGAEVPTDEQVLEYGKGWPGMPATGVPASIPDHWLLSWLAWRKSPKGGPFPSDWKGDIGRRWSSDYLKGLREQKPAREDQGETKRLNRL